MDSERKHTHNGRHKQCAQLQLIAAAIVAAAAAATSDALLVQAELI